MDHLCYLCLVFVILSYLFIAALWSPTGKGLTSWLSFVMLNCVFVTFPCGIPCGILGQVWYLIVLIPDLCRLSYFALAVALDIWEYDKNTLNFNFIISKVPKLNPVLMIIAIFHHNISIFIDPHQNSGCCWYRETS